jgi:hypothetical protein
MLTAWMRWFPASAPSLKSSRSRQMRTSDDRDL